MTSGPVMGAPAPVLSDGVGVSLRPHREDDLDAIYDLCQDAEMQRWTTIPVPYSHRDADRFLGHVRDGWENGTLAAFAIEMEDRFAGNVDLRLEPGLWGEVGYAVAPWARGRNLMTRALAIALAWGFEELQLEGIRWCAHAGNVASRRVAEKCGFRLDGMVRGLLLQRGHRVDGWVATLLPNELAVP